MDICAIIDNRQDERWHGYVYQVNTPGATNELMGGAGLNAGTTCGGYLLDMHYFLIENDVLDNDEFEEGFYIDLF